MPTRFTWCFILLVVLTLCGCKTTNVPNPSFPVTRSEARDVIKDMEDDPKILQRPVVILSGFLDPGIAASSIRGSLENVMKGGPVITGAFTTKGNFDSARDALIEEIESAVPSPHPDETVEVDLITHSMGGLVARYASLPRSDGKRLRIARLFTLATPHRGAKMSEILPINDLAGDMDKDSEFMAMMAEVDHPFPIIPYVMLGDQIVGERNAAPHGTSPWWVDRPLFAGPHLGITDDDRVLADIFRRLRNEQSLTVEPPAPLPGFVD